MGDTDKTTETTDAATTKTDDAPKKKAAPKTIHVQVLRAVDAYHARGSHITVPNDEYHRGLLSQGNLKVVG